MSVGQKRSEMMAKACNQPLSSLDSGMGVMFRSQAIHNGNLKQVWPLILERKAPKCPQSPSRSRRRKASQTIKAIPVMSHLTNFASGSEMIQTAKAPDAELRIWLDHLEVPTSPRPQLYMPLRCLCVIKLLELIVHHGVDRVPIQHADY